MRRTSTTLALLVAGTLVIGATGEESGTPKEAVATLPGSAAPVLKVTGVTIPAQTDGAAAAIESPTVQPLVLKVYSVNGGGSPEVQVGNVRLGVSVAQPVAGATGTGTMRAELGYWYMVSDAYVCPVVLAGDVNASGHLATSDVIYLVNFVLKAGPEPQPCVGTGDVNCDGQVVTSDIIYLVNHVLKAMSPPCDVCALMPGTWPCP